MTDYYIYEQPLNEKVRSFLRLEKLFQEYVFHMENGTEWNNRIAINAILQILAYTTRSDVKLEVLKELERQYSRLERLARRPQIDQAQLSSVLENIQIHIGELQAIGGQIGHETKKVELLSAIAQKSSVPGSIWRSPLGLLRAEAIFAMNFEDPKRGEVVVFESPNEGKLLVKRIVALPNEKFMIQEGAIIVDGVPLLEIYLDPYVTTKGKNKIKSAQEITVPADSYIVLGDNRDNSTDSRDFGPIKKESIVGRAFMVYQPFENMRIIRPSEQR